MMKEIYQRSVYLVILLATTANGATNTNDNLLDFFPSTYGDGVNVIWAHGVNSIAHLNQSLADDTMMLESDIILRGMGTENQTDIPVLAHPPLTDSDLTLEYFLQVTTKHPDKGMKLDFKTFEAVEPSMKLIEKYESELKAPLWLNADIVIGPNSPRDPVEPQPFIYIVNRYFDQTTLSLGWTTAWDPTMPDKMYTWTMIFDILYYSYPLHPQPVTFPIRAVWSKTSWPKLVWLLGLRESFSVTIWSSSTDEVDVGGLVDLRTYGDMKRIFYDLPETQKQEFLDALNDSLVTPSPSEDTLWDRDQWAKFESQDGRNFAYFSTESVGISGTAPRVALVHSKTQHIPDAGIMRVKGRVQFVDRYDSTGLGEVEIAIWSRSLLDDKDERDAILAGSEDPSGILYRIRSDGRLYISTAPQNDINMIDSECYEFEIEDNPDPEETDWIHVYIRTCSDALVDNPNDESKFSFGVTFPPKKCDQEYYVIVSKIGGGKDIILEDLHITGSRNGSEPNTCTTTPRPVEMSTSAQPEDSYTTESKGFRTDHGVSLWVLVMMMMTTMMIIATINWRCET